MMTVCPGYVYCILHVFVSVLHLDNSEVISPSPHTVAEPLLDQPCFIQKESTWQVSPDYAPVQRVNHREAPLTFKVVIKQIMETGTQQLRNAKVSQGKRYHEQVLCCGELDVHSRGQTYTTNRGFFWHLGWAELMFIQMSFIISQCTQIS